MSTSSSVQMIKRLRGGKASDFSFQAAASVNLESELLDVEICLVVRLKDQPWHEIGTTTLKDK